MFSYWFSRAKWKQYMAGCSRGFAYAQQLDEGSGLKYLDVCYELFELRRGSTAEDLAKVLDPKDFSTFWSKQLNGEPVTEPFVKGFVLGFRSLSNYFLVD